MKFNTIPDLLDTLERMTPEFTDGVESRLQVTLNKRLKGKHSQEELLVALEDFADAIKDDVYRYREFTHPDNKLKTRTTGTNVDDITCIELFEIPAFYDDCRVDPVNPEKCTLKRLESRHSDDGEVYYCELANSMPVNHSGTFFVTAKDYETIRLSELNKSSDPTLVRIYCQDDLHVNHGLDQIIKSK